MKEDEKQDEGAPPGAPSSVTVDVAKAMEVALWLHQANRLAEAEAIYLAVLKIHPCHVDALHYLGVVRHQTGGPGAIELIRASLQFAPENASAWSNLGNLLRATGDRDGALEAYRKAAALDPGNAPALNNIGVLLKEMGRLEEAREAYEKAIAINPELAEAHRNLGHVFKRLGRINEAVASYAKAAALRPDNASQWNLSSSLHLAGQTDRAVAVVREWLTYDPRNPRALHLLAALSGENIPARASDEFIKDVFDSFAETFDEKLRSLEYKAPELVARAVERDLGPPRSALRVLDAGCGTGLCGPLLKPYAARLSGVDLSAAMAARARSRGIYDDLVVAELTSHLAAQSEAFDLIVSADTLCYFGDLGEVFSAASQALAGGGRFIFTLEDAADNAAPNGVRLNPHGRYSHTQAHVRQGLASVGLLVADVASVVLRFEAGEAVAGLLVTARKPAAECASAPGSG